MKVVVLVPINKFVAAIIYDVHSVVKGTLNSTCFENTC